MVSKSVPLNSIYFPASTVLMKHQHFSLYTRNLPKVGKSLPPVPDIVSGISIFLPPQSYAIAGMECKNNIIRDIGDAAATICRCVDGVVELGVVLDIWYGGSVLSTLVIYVDLVIPFSLLSGRR